MCVDELVGVRATATRLVARVLASVDRPSWERRPSRAFSWDAIVRSTRARCSSDGDDLDLTAQSRRSTQANVRSEERAGERLGEGDIRCVVGSDIRS